MNAPRWEDSVLETAFMNGLKPQTRAGVQMLEPPNLDRMMSLSVKVENRDSQGGQGRGTTGGLYGRPSRDSGGRFISGDTRLGQMIQAGSYQPKPNNHYTRESRPLNSFTRDYRPTAQYQNVSQSRERNLAPQTSHFSRGQNNAMENRRTPTKWLTEGERNEKRAQGLCYRCNEKYHTGHRCKYRELRVLMIREDGTESVVEDDEEEEVVGDVVVPLDPAENAELSVRSVVGISAPRTMKVKGQIKEEPVVVLIDIHIGGVGSPLGSTNGYDSRLWDSVG